MVKRDWATRVMFLTSKLAIPSLLVMTSALWSSVAPAFSSSPTLEVVGAAVLISSPTSTLGDLISWVWLLFSSITSGVVSGSPLSILGLYRLKGAVGLCPREVRVAATPLFLAAEALPKTACDDGVLLVSISLEFKLYLHICKNEKS